MALTYLLETREQKQILLEKVAQHIVQVVRTQCSNSGE